MLDERDLAILKNTMESVLNERLAKSETAILEKVDERLAKSETAILEKVDERLAKSETTILEKVDERLAKSENLVLDEMERTRSILENRIDKVEREVDGLKQYYRITKSENDNAMLLLKLIEQLSKRVEELERKIA